LGLVNKYHADNSGEKEEIKSRKAEVRRLNTPRIILEFNGFGG